MKLRSTITLAFAALLAQTLAGGEPEETYRSAAKFQFANGREALAAVEADIRATAPEQYKDIETKLLAALKVPDATVTTAAGGVRNEGKVVDGGKNNPCRCNPPAAGTDFEPAAAPSAAGWPQRSAGQPPTSVRSMRPHEPRCRPPPPSSGARGLVVVASSWCRPS